MGLLARQSRALGSWKTRMPGGKKLEKQERQSLYQNRQRTTTLGTYIQSWTLDSRGLTPEAWP
jgi:hypothetical protein